MDLLGDAHDYFDDRSDIEDGDYGVPRPNTEMWLMNRCERVMDSLPAILAALTEAEALKAQVAAGQAREVALRKLAAYMAEDVCQCDENLGTQCASCFARDYLSAPTDTAALRAMLRAAWIDGIDGDDGSNSADAYIDRVLGGS